MSLKSINNKVLLLTTAIIFLGYAIFQHIGWNVMSTGVSKVFRVLPQVYVCLFLSAFILFKKYVNLHKIKIEIRFIYFSIIVFFYFLLGHRTASILRYANNILYPVLFSVCLMSLSSNNDNKLWKIIIAFFYIECFWAIGERLLHQIIFPTIYDTNIETFQVIDDVTGFRSQALHGHPLNNALIIDIIMSFILFANIKETKKLMLFALGFIALLCFNTRSSIIFMSVVYAIYILNNIISLKKRLNIKLISVFFSIIIVVLCYYLIYEYGLGDRIVNGELLDKSGQARLIIWEIISKLSLSDVLYGFDMNKLLSIAYTFGLWHIESWWIIFMCDFGLVVLIPVLIFFFKLFQRYLKGFSKFEVLVTISTFFIVSSSNNSLACGVPAIIVFFTCCKALKASNIS